VVGDKFDFSGTDLQKNNFLFPLPSRALSKCSLVVAISRRSGYHGHFPSGKANDELMTVVARVTQQLRAMGQPLGPLPDGSSH
jgi:hypothetical protein